MGGEAARRMQTAFVRPGRMAALELDFLFHNKSLCVALDEVILMVPPPPRRLMVELGALNARSLAPM